MRFGLRGVTSGPLALTVGVAGAYWDGANNGTPLSTRVLAADTFEIAPVLVARPGVRIDAIGAIVTAGGAAGTMLRVYLYRDRGDGYPGALLYASRDLPADAPAHVEDVLAQPLALPAGLLWVAYHTQDAPTLRARAPGASLPISKAGTNPVGTTYFTVSRSVVAFATTPDPAPTPGVLQPNVGAPCLPMRLVA